MRNSLGIGLMATGIVLVVIGSRSGGDSETQILGVMGGFVAAVAGVVMVFGDTGESLEAGSGAVTETDTPARVRLLGIVITLGSLALPYIRLPFGSAGGVERTGYSFVGIVSGLYQGSITLASLGEDLSGGFVLLIFAAVVIAGAFASILHHIGGYVVLFGAAGYGYVVSLTVDAQPVDVVVSEFQIGLYVAVIGALIIVGSSFLSYGTEEKDRDVFGGGR
ncbi:MAG: hypothetical protein ACLFR5_04265 [Halobacteriales archaeon]